MKKSLSPIALILVFVLMFTLTACGSKDGDTGETGATGGEEADLTKAYHVGINTWGTAPVLQMYGDEAAFAVETMGLTYDRASDDNNADKEVQNIQNFISQGVDGLCIQGAGTTTIPQMGNEAKSAKVPFCLYIFTGTPEVRDELSANNEFYAGAAASDLQADGRVLAEKALADGAKTACIIGGNIGDLNMDNRSKGFTEAFEKGGGKILAEERCTDNSETQAKASSMLSANKDVDAIYIMVGDYVEGTFTAIDTLGITGVKSYLSSVNPASAEHLRSGRIEAGSGGAALSANIAPTLMLNMLDGHVIKDDKGNAPFFQVPTSLVTKDNVDAYVEVFFNESTKAVSPDIIKKLTYRFNKDVTYETYVEVIENDLTVDAIIKAAGK